MKCLAITYNGLEDIAAKEIKELTKAKCTTKETVVLFNAGKEKLAELCYRAQSLIKVLWLLDSFKFKDLFKEAEKSVKKLKLDMLKKKTFSVRCKRIGEHGFSSQEAAAKIGEFILKNVKTKVDLENPDYTIYIYVYQKKAYLGIDFTDFDLSKRDYKVFAHAGSIKGTIAYSLLRIADYKKTQTMIDPFSDGMIPIEAALFVTGFPVNFYRKEKFAFLKFVSFNFDKIDKKTKLKQKTKINSLNSQMPFVRSAQKNAKIAGMNKNINFSRMDVEWLDTKFKKAEIDKIVTKINFTKRTNQKDFEKIIKELFYQADFILKKKGKIVIMTNAIEIIKKYADRFKILEERQIKYGEEKPNIIVFGK